MKQINIQYTDSSVRFLLGDTLVGDYVLNDPYKPHFRHLRTPAGHETVLVSPGDHRHHKGLMYALRCPDVNFWEEDPGSGACGVQEILSTTPVSNGLRQSLLWRELNGGLHTYKEEREITAELCPDGKAIRWLWKTKRAALRDHVLSKSQWSLELPDGRKINYHGLGVRLPWMWRFPVSSMCGVELNGSPVEPVAACGTTVPTMGFWGLIDGNWNKVAAAVTISQPASQSFTWFVLKTDFPYLSVGPSNANEVDVREGDIHEESYEILVQDRPEKV